MSAGRSGSGALGDTTRTSWDGEPLGDLAAAVVTGRAAAAPSPVGPGVAARRAPLAVYEPMMRRALQVAVAAPRTGDVPIGAVVVDAEGRELAAACNAREALRDPTAHAEILAVRAAAAVRREWRLTGCTLAVTVEPCAMCAGAIGLARIERVVFGAWEPKTGAVGSLWDVLRDRRAVHRPEVVSGVLADECAALLESFFAQQR